MHPPGFDAAVCAADYAPPLDRLALAIKHAHRVELSVTLGRLLADAFARTPCAALDVLVPIPLSRERLAARGFNQSTLLARTLGANTAPVDPGLLARVLDTPVAAHLNRAQRAEALRGAFAATRRLDDLRIGLVDDVMTTGATMHAAALALKAAGAREVVALAALRTALN